MLKLLVFVLVLVAIFWGRRLISQKGNGARPSAGHKRTAEPERMLACQRCGLHIPESEAVERAGAHYCCEAHARGRDD